MGCIFYKACPINLVVGMSPQDPLLPLSVPTNATGPGASARLRGARLVHDGLRWDDAGSRPHNKFLPEFSGFGALGFSVSRTKLLCNSSCYSSGMARLVPCLERSK